MLHVSHTLSEHLYGLVLEHQSAQNRGSKVQFLMGTQTFPLSHTHDMKKNIYQ